MTSPAADPSPARVPALDALRGIAALVVVVHHAMLISPNLAGHFIGRPVTGRLARLLTYSPLHAPWAGNEAVVVFFVLSGFVLARPWVGRRQAVGRYLARRAARLYLPVFGAVGLALLWRIVDHRAVAGASWWLDLHTSPVTAGEIRAALFLHRLPEANLISVLWSLHLEVVFSIVLPALALLLPVIRRLRWVAVLLVLLATAAALATDQGLLLTYLPAFVLGVTLAVHEPWLRSRVPVPSLAVAAMAAAVAVLLLTAPWSLYPIGERRSGARELVEAVGGVAVLLGAAVAVCIALRSDSANGLLHHPAVRWLGARSFSLYLVHEPAIVTLALVLGQRELSIPFVVLAVTLSIALSAVFHRLVERPSQVLSQRLSRPAVADGPPYRWR